MYPADPGVTPWKAMTEGDMRRFGPTILDPVERKRWCTAILIGGLPYMWNHIAVDMRAKAIDKLALRPGATVLLLGEEIEGIGFDRDIGAAIGNEGHLEIVDMREQVLALVSDGKNPQWRYDYTNRFADGAFDSILVGQGVAHAEDWAREGGELIRTLKPGGALVMCEISFGSKFFARFQEDIHLTYWVTKITEGMGITLSEMASHNIEVVAAALDSKLDGLGWEEWRGCELLHGTKPLPH